MKLLRIIAVAAALGLTTCTLAMADGTTATGKGGGPKPSQRPDRRTSPPDRRQPRPEDNSGTPSFQVQLPNLNGIVLPNLADRLKQGTKNQK